MGGFRAAFANDANRVHSKLHTLRAGFQAAYLHGLFGDEPLPLHLRQPA
ncbi:hypothetical protein [Kingella sp. (in: b-proteobacteria)]|nr:hypothetical protein [Kingella sp. (in: b-proteobacteria)]MDO4656854.1 hypothetical protein [Kingella sp. (in: b-proteobacteria)]